METRREKLEKQELKGIVQRARGNLKCEVFLFGSRADGSSPKRSDYDLGVRGLTPVEFRRFKSRIEDEHEDSHILPGIDVVNFETVDADFAVEATQEIEEWLLD